ncbi:hypothetical protein GOP47_0026039 [Adiantum capillus-veneris]|uniref:Uncharacterized protein n=1 Tax=Adiantum capillus-veneris TaxID=13818 RepID=A0A9D4U1K5_ADICA|nr:hypothetical protein GOP47_0026039 [Adiantum capillus-veneris]
MVKLSRSWFMAKQRYGMRACRLNKSWIGAHWKWHSEAVMWSTCSGVKYPQWSEVKQMMDNLKQSLHGDFRAFVWEFETTSSKLVKVTAVENADFLKLTKFMYCLHVKVRDKVEMDGPCTYEEAVASTQSKTKKILKKQHAKQVLASPLVSRPIAREEAQVIRPFVDAHVVTADRRDDRVETIPCGSMRPQQL